MSLVTLGHFQKRTSNRDAFLSDGASYFGRSSDVIAATEKRALLPCLRGANSEVLKAESQSEQRYKIVSSRNETQRGKMFSALEAKNPAQLRQELGAGFFFACFDSTTGFSRLWGLKRNLESNCPMAFNSTVFL